MFGRHVWRFCCHLYLKETCKYPQTTSTSKKSPLRKEVLPLDCRPMDITHFSCYALIAVPAFVYVATIAQQWLRLSLSRFSSPGLAMSLPVCLPYRPGERRGHPSPPGAARFWTLCLGGLMRTSAERRDCAHVHATRKGHQYKTRRYHHQVKGMGEHLTTTVGLYDHARPHQKFNTATSTC